MVLPGDLGFQLNLVTVPGSSVCFPWTLWAWSPFWRGLCLSCCHPQPPVCLFLWSSPSLASTLTTLTLFSPEPSMVELGLQVVWDLTPQDIPLASYWPSHPAEDYGQHAKARHTPVGFSYSSCSTPLCRLSKNTFLSPAFLQLSISELLSRPSPTIWIKTTSFWSSDMVLLIHAGSALHSH